MEFLPPPRGSAPTREVSLSREGSSKIKPGPRAGSGAGGFQSTSISSSSPFFFASRSVSSSSSSVRAFFRRRRLLRLLLSHNAKRELTSNPRPAKLNYGASIRAREHVSFVSPSLFLFFPPPAPAAIRKTSREARIRAVTFLFDRVVQIYSARCANGRPFRVRSL